MKGDAPLPRNKYPEETKEKIIDAGLLTFQEKGYEASTVLDVVANMNGLTRGAFYHHFKSKEELLSAICERIFIANNPFDKVAENKALNGLQKIREALKINISSQSQHDAFAVLQDVGSELSNSPHFFKWQMEFNAKFGYKSVLPLIEEGIGDGSIKNQDAQTLSELFVVLFSIWLSSSLFPGDKERAEKKAVAIFEILDFMGMNIYDNEMEELGMTWIDESFE